MKDLSKCALIYKTLHLKQKSLDYLFYPKALRSRSACYNGAVDKCLFLTVTLSFAVTLFYVRIRVTSASGQVEVRVSP